jgi:hypothetical protein
VHEGTVCINECVFVWVLLIVSFKFVFVFLRDQFSLRSYSSLLVLQDAGMRNPWVVTCHISEPEALEFSSSCVHSLLQKLPVQKTRPISDKSCYDSLMSYMLRLIVLQVCFKACLCYSYWCC